MVQKILLGQHLSKGTNMLYLGINIYTLGTNMYF